MDDQEQFYSLLWTIFLHCQGPPSYRSVAVKRLISLVGASPTCVFLFHFLCPTDVSDWDSQGTYRTTATTLGIRAICSVTSYPDTKHTGVELTISFGSHRYFNQDYNAPPGTTFQVHIFYACLLNIFYSCTTI